VIFGVDRNRVRYVAIADGELVAERKLLRRYLRHGAVR
jgi:hypothetical protein